MVERSYSLKIFHANNLSVVLEIFHVFNFRGTKVPTKIILPQTFPNLRYISHFNVQSTKQTKCSSPNAYAQGTVWHKILTVENFDESGLGKF